MHITFFLPKISRLVLVFSIILLTHGVFGDAPGIESLQADQYRIGVLLPASGDSAMDFYETLHWTVAGLEKEGVGSIELVSIDTSTVPIGDAAKEMLADPDIRVVIGPATSEEVFQIAPDFIAAKKLLITPSATSGEIADLFGESGYVWRTTGGDRIQIQLIMDLVAERGAESVALLYENNTYGRTFADWSLYYAREYGISHAGSVPFSGEREISSLLNLIISKKPDYLIVAARASFAAEIARLVKTQNSSVKVLYTDAARSETFLTTGEYAEGAEGLSPTADKKTGFFVAYQKAFGKMPSDYAALTRDALVLGIAALARMEREPSEDIRKAITSVVQGRDIVTPWDDQGTAQAIRLIRAGYLPDLSGASGPLNYDTRVGSDPLTTWYVHWRVEEGEFLSDSYIPGSRGDEGETDTIVSPMQNLSDFQDTNKDPRTEIAFVYDGEKGDFGFTDQAYHGILRARDDFNLTVHEIFTGDTNEEPDPVWNPVTGKKAGAVLMLGSYMAGYAERVKRQYPDIPVMVIDADPVSLPGIKTASFSMYGASYLAGRLAADQTKTGQIAVIAGRKAQVIDSFTDGFVRGAADEDPMVLVNITYIADDNSGYQQPEKGAAIAEDMYQNGTDIIFTVAGESGLGAISAAKGVPDLKIIGVDSDQSYLGPGVVIASVVKNLDSVVYHELSEALSGRFTHGLVVYNLSTDGASVAINPRFRDLSGIIENRMEEAVKKETSVITGE